MVTQAGAVTRRTLLRASLTGLGGVATLGLTGCGSRHKVKVSPRVGATDAEMLNELLAIEQRSIAAYTAVAPLLDGFGQKMAGQFLSQQLAHAGLLRTLVKQVGGKPHNPHMYRFGHPRGRTGLLALLHGLEREQIEAYLRTIPRLATTYLRQNTAAILANHAQHVTVLRAQQGMTPLTGPFLTAGE